MIKKIKIRSAVILCGGRGSRLGILSKKIPKTLVSVQNKKIIWFIINILKKNKFNQFILPVGYKAHAIKNFIKKNFKNLKNIEIIDTGLNSSIASRIYKIKNYIKSSNFLLLNGDAIFDFDINQIYKKHVKNNYIMTFVSAPTRANFGTIGTQNKKIINFQRDFKFNYVKSKYKQKLKNYVYSGISIMNKVALNKNFKKYKNFEQKLYPWIIKKFKCNVEELNGFFHSIDNQKDIYTVNSIKSENSSYLKVKNIINYIIKTK